MKLITETEENGFIHTQAINNWGSSRVKLAYDEEKNDRIDGMDYARNGIIWVSNFYKPLGTWRIFRIFLWNCALKIKYGNLKHAIMYFY